MATTFEGGICRDSGLKAFIALVTVLRDTPSCLAMSSAQNLSLAYSSWICSVLSRLGCEKYLLQTLHSYL